jgi:hypothetical protein
LESQENRDTRHLLENDPISGIAFPATPNDVAMNPALLFHSWRGATWLGSGVDAVIGDGDSLTVAPVGRSVPLAAC